MRVGIIGLGAMGLPMAANIVKAGTVNDQALELQRRSKGAVKVILGIVFLPSDMNISNNHHVEKFRLRHQCHKAIQHRFFDHFE